MENEGRVGDEPSHVPTHGGHSCNMISVSSSSHGVEKCCHVMPCDLYAKKAEHVVCVCVCVWVSLCNCVLAAAYFSEGGRTKDKAHFL